MNNNPFPIKQMNSLNIELDELGGAYSNDYRDIYFQPHIGLSEKQHVFIKGNGLPEKWLNKDCFCIGETGFGVGLNFLSTLKLWNQDKQHNRQLHYISCESLPLNQQQLSKAWSCFPELKLYSERLIEKYPEQLISGVHRIHFKQFNTTLTLIFADAVDAFENINATIDAWYLDGFAPSKNPNMWSTKLFTVIAKLSRIGTTIATYTVAKKTRQRLTDVGFEVTKIKGYGQKREMLTGKMTTAHKTIEKQPWHQTFSSVFPSGTHSCFTVLGAGIAGLSMAQKLQAQGKNVTLIDRQHQPCLETSGNPQAMIMPSFDLNDSPESRFYLAAFLYAIKYYSKKYYHSVGVHQLAFSKKQQVWQEKLLTRFNLPKTLLQKYKNGILYPQAGWLDTQGYAQSIFQQITNYLQVEVNKIERKDNLWFLYANNKVVHTTQTLILANGINAKALLPNYEMPIVPKLGEISYFNSAKIDKKIASAKHIQLSKGYITPSWNGIQTIGATFDHISEKHWFKPPTISEKHWQKNTKLWQDTPYAELFTSNISHKSRAGIRVTTPDHLPICGAAINQSKFKKDYHDIRHGKHWKQYSLPQTEKNLYIMTGLGSRGFTCAPLLAEFLCNQILDHPQALDKIMQKTINPNRFLFKKLLRECNYSA